MTEAIESISALIVFATAGILLALDTEDRAAAGPLAILMAVSLAIMILAYAADVVLA